MDMRTTLELQARKVEGAIALLQAEHSTIVKVLATLNALNNTTALDHIRTLSSESQTFNLSSVPPSAFNQCASNSLISAMFGVSDGIAGRRVADSPDLHAEMFHKAIKRAHDSSEDETSESSSKKQCQDKESPSEKKPSNVGKTVLDSKAACQIYSARPPPADLRAGRARKLGMKLAEQYGVTAKTIRDIWNRSTWARATRSLWTEEESETYLEACRSEGGAVGILS